MAMNNWAKNAIDGGAERALYQVQESLPVSLIATTRNQFVSCRCDDNIADVYKHKTNEDFDFLPVLDSNCEKETIIGLLHLDENLDRAKKVRDSLTPLGEQMLIGSDASILDFMSDVDSRPFRYLVSGSEISGLVTLSDMQRLPVRVALFAFITQIEMAMTDVIRQRYPHEKWEEVFSENDLQQVNRWANITQAAGTAVDKLLCTSYFQKISIIRATPEWHEELNLDKDFLQEQQEIVYLRNNLAHAKNFASTRNEAEKLAHMVRGMRVWLADLEQL